VTFSYYPDWQVYNNLENMQWFWIEGGQWKIGTYPPNWIHLGKARIIHVSLDATAPFSQHSIVLGQYPPDYRYRKNSSGHHGHTGHSQDWGSNRKHHKNSKQYIWWGSGGLKIGIEIP